MRTMRQLLAEGSLHLAERRGVVASLAAALMLGACAQSGDMLSNTLGVADSTTGSETKSVADASGGQSELQKATDYWGQEYAKKPAELQPALNYARNLKALGEKRKAFAVLQQASTIHDGDPELASEYGRLALEFDQISVAEKLLAVADNPGKPDWRVISARGTVQAKKGEFKNALEFYERALAVSPNQPSVLNNIAMAHAALGDPAKAETYLKEAAAQTGATAKVQENMALVLGLQGRYDEAKQVASTAMPAAAASSNTDYIRSMVQLAPKAAPTTDVASESAKPAAVAAVAAFKPSTTESGSAAAVEAPTASAWATDVSAAAGASR